MRRRLTMRLGAAGIGALVVLALAAPPAYGLVRAADPVPPAGLTGLEPTGADMPTVGGNLGNQHYSGLTQITKDNLEQLAPAWRTHVSAVAPATDDVGQQTTPIVVDGVIYLDTPERRRDRRRRRDGRAGLEVGEPGVRAVGHPPRSIGGRRQDLHARRRQPRRRARPGHRRAGLGRAAHRGRTARTSDASERSRPCTSTGSSTPTRRTATAGRSSRSTRATDRTCGTSSADRSAASCSQVSTA